MPNDVRGGRAMRAAGSAKGVQWSPRTCFISPIVNTVSRTTNLSAFLWARRLNSALSARLRESLAKQDSKLVH
ncbi:hypothetical protein, partial [Burkholderia vietnamiensis]|uniref:hypothetical protein n=1 Tax=Burkholderia vietnamiensis TaxID=60552 RepID=UPI001ABB7C41